MNPMVAGVHANQETKSGMNRIWMLILP